jgi:hypothetical protein
LNILRGDATFKLVGFDTLTRIGDFAEGAGPYISLEALAYPHGPHPVTHNFDELISFLANNSVPSITTAPFGLGNQISMLAPAVRFYLHLFELNYLYRFLKWS